jgi:phage shock protein PspC (stress-responsive transcriptional regulator)
LKQNSQSDIQQTNGLKSWLSEGLLLASLSALSYAATFAYEAGYAEHFGIPYKLISISLTTTIIAAASILAAIIPVYLISNFIWMFTPKGDDTISSAIRRYIKMVIITLPIVVVWQAWVIFLIYALLLAYIEFISPLFAHKEKSSYKEKLLAQDRIEQNAKVHLLWHVIDKRVGSWLVDILIYSAMVLGIAYVLGTKNAENQKEFYLFSDKESEAILAIYDSTIVSAVFDRNKKAMQKSLHISKIDSEKILSIKKEKVGPLSVQQD